MPGKKPKQKAEKPQRERFLETAKEIETGDSKEAFEKAFKKIVPQKRTASGPKVPRS
jgi:hypothetical protein